MKKNLTEMVFIIDKSGSMRGLESDTVGGFNSMLEKQRKARGEALVSTVFFNDYSVVVRDRDDIKNVENLTVKDYCPGGSTALLDAVGETVSHIQAVHRYIRDEDLPEHTIFVIITDGMENASRRYSKSKVKNMIERRQEERKWEFVFLGANIDAVQTAESYGISADMSADFINDEAGLAGAYEALDDVLQIMRKNQKPTKEWKKNLEKSFADPDDSRDI